MATHPSHSGAWVVRLNSVDHGLADAKNQWSADQENWSGSTIIFPRRSVMMFKKGSFEVSSTVWPIAMKYDHRLGDPFWNSNRQGYLAYLLGMMSAWALICDVWYLPEMHRMVRKLIGTPQKIRENRGKFLECWKVHLQAKDNEWLVKKRSKTQ